MRTTTNYCMMLRVIGESADDERDRHAACMCRLSGHHKARKLNNHQLTINYYSNRTSITSTMMAINNIDTLLPDTNYHNHIITTTTTSDNISTMMTTEETNKLKRILSNSTNIMASNSSSIRPLKKRKLSESTSSCTTEAKPKKQVRFQEEPQIYTYDRVEAYDVPLVWLTREEMQCNRYHDGQWIQCYSGYDPYLNDLLQLLGMACGKSVTSFDTATEVADAQVRGLEREISPCFRQRKRQVVANVLRSQAALKAWKEKRCQEQDDPNADDFAAKVLSRHYRKLAQPSVRFARLLAQGDAQVVVKLDEAKQQEEQDEESALITDESSIETS